jgi:hypothetical protein
MINFRNFLMTLSIVIISCIGTVLFITYDRGTNSFKTNKLLETFDSHSKDREEIKNQIERAYFGLSTLNYGTDGPLFYNQNVSTAMSMLMIPMYLLTNNLKFETDNISIESITEKTASVKYDLIVITNKTSKKVSISMIVKKIGGKWMLDRENFFDGEMLSQVEKERERKIQNYRNENSTLGGGGITTTISDTEENPNNASDITTTTRIGESNQENDPQFEDGTTVITGSEDVSYEVKQKEVTKGGIGGSLDIAGWNCDYYPNIKDESDESGRIVIGFKIDSQGKIIKVWKIESNLNPSVYKLYEAEVRKMTFTKKKDNISSASTTDGKITFMKMSKVAD